MYEELIATLRESRDKRMLDAADAIEELQKLTDAQLDIIKQYQGYLTKHRWIPVEERLPDVFERVITYDKTHGVVLNHRCADNMSWWIGFHVTHWMPLPMPPKEE